MINKLIPEQISTFWPIIKYAIEESLPPLAGEHPDKMNRMLAAMLSGKLDVWISYKKEDMKFEAVLVTQFLYDDASNTMNLLLYCLYGYSTIASDSWKEGLEAMYKYAKAKGCHSIIAYSANPDIIEKAKEYKADTSYTFISIPVK